MCGVFGLSNLVKFNLEERFQVGDTGILPEEWEGIIFRPHSQIPTVSRNSPNSLVLRYWSLIPPWIKDIDELKFPTFNARSETVREKASFKGAWNKGNRCLIPCTEFWEYRDNGKGKPKTAFKFSLPSGEPFSLAGLYQPWKEIQTATIITTEANHDSKDIHNRLPVVLSQEEEAMWLNKATPFDEAYKLLKPYPEGELRIEETISPLKQKKSSK